MHYTLVNFFLKPSDFTVNFWSTKSKIITENHLKSPEITKVKISETIVIPWFDSIYSKLLYTVVRFRNEQVAGSNPVTSSNKTTQNRHFLDMRECLFF